MLSACGGGGGGTGTGTSTPVVTPPTLYPTTALITSNMLDNYNFEKTSVLSTNQGCFRLHGLSGNSLACSTTAKESAVVTFLNTVTANIRATSLNSAIDKLAIVDLLSKYKATDLAWLNVDTFSPTIIMSAAEVASLSGGYTNSINASYSNAILLVNSL